jgi:hypothetical protein
VCAAIVNTIGLLASSVGVVLLFWFAMPYRQRGPRSINIGAEPKEIRLDARYDALGRLGLALILSGTALQIAGAWI